jgi:hypothetical protein
MQSSSRRQVAKTRQPFCDRVWAASYPIPVEHPVIKIVFLVKTGLSKFYLSSLGITKSIRSPEKNFN